MSWNPLKKRRAALSRPMSHGQGAKRRNRPRLEQLEDRTLPSIVTPFSVRFSTDNTGDIAIIGNTLETATTVGNPGRTAQDVTDAQNGVGANVNNNNWNMAYVDVDGNAATFDSSQATLNLPVGATVLFAGLYWGGNSNSALRNQVLFSTPASSGYVGITGAVLGDTTPLNPPPNPPGPNYESFDDVTALVQAGGIGTYMVANVQATAASNTYAGWSLVVAYSVPGDPLRNLTVFDGYGAIQNGEAPVNIPVSGFVAPPTGAVNAKVGVVAYEGDLGLTGDQLLLNGTALSDAAHPANNFFDSTIANLGTSVTAKNPNFVNQLGFDASIVQAPAGTIANGATSATLTLVTVGDTYFPGALTTSIDLYQPNLVSTKTVTDLNGGNVVPGDILQYTINVANSGQDAAGSVVLNDLIPTNTTYVPGSLQIVSGANAGAQTDVSGDDEAEFAGNQVVFRLGTGANAANGGTLAVGESTTIQFDVLVNAGTPANTVINNQATIDYIGVTTDFPFTGSSTLATVTTTSPSADLALAKTVSNRAPNVGDNVTYTVTLTNNGPDTATGVTVTDFLPAGLQFVSSSPSQGTYNAASGLWTVGTVANGTSVTLTIVAQVTASTAQTNTATISNSNAPDPNSFNNTASVTETPLQSDLALAKTVSNANPNTGDVVTYTVTLTNNGPDTATGVIVTDHLPAGLLLVSDLPSQGSYNGTSGLWTVGTVANGASATLTIVAQVTATAPQTNTATISNSDVFDPNKSNNTASVTESPASADLVLTKVANQTTATVGQNVTYTLRIRNNGPDSATNVVVTDTLPVGLTFVSAAPPSQGTFNPATGVWTVGTLANGQTAILQVTARITAAGSSVNSADATALQFDPDLANNRATATVTGINPVTGISKRQFLASTFVDPPGPVANAALAVPDLQSAISFVDNLYQAVLNRTPAAGEINSWVNALETGISRQTVVQAFWNSPEHLGLEVDQLYTQILHRAADPAGRAGWVNLLMQGHGTNDVELAMLGSSEYMTTHSSSSSFVQGLYNDVLGRAADSAGFTAWLQALQGGANRSLVAAAFVNSAEAVANVVNRDYVQFLLRPADAAGRNAWVAAEQSGALTLEQVGEAVLVSDEFFALP